MKPAIPHTRRNLLETALGLGCMLAATLPSARAATLYWDGVTGGWDSVANWSTAAGATTPDPAAVPGAADDAVFNIDTADGPVVVGLNAARSANSIVFNNTGTTALEGGGTNQTLALGAGGILMDAAAGAATIGSATDGQNVVVTLTATQAWTNNSAAQLSIANPFTSAAGIGLTKAGTGPVAMTNALNTTNIGGVLDVQAGKFLMHGDVTVGGLTGAGTVEIGGAASKWFFLNNAADHVFSGGLRNASATARMGLVKGGGGMLTLSGTNTLGDNFAVGDGLVKITGTTTAGVGGANGTTSIGTVGNQNGRMLVEGGTLNATKNTSPSVAIATAANSRGFLKMTSGSISSTSEFHIGRGQTGSFSAYTQTGGAMTSGSWLVVGLNNDRAVLNQSGGSISVTSNRMTIGAGGNASVGVVNLSGGTLDVAAGANTGVFVGENGTGTLNLSGSAALTLATNGGANSGTLQFAGNGSSLAGNVNLLGGTASVFGVTKGASTAGGIYRLNFNGGTLKAAAPNAAFFADLANTEAYVFGGGGTVHNGGHAITIAEPLLAPAGNGVSAAGLTVSGGGYLDTPLVTITGGGGTGATAVAVIDANGNLTGIQITNPGINYTSAPTFALVGGGVGNTGSISGTATLVPNTAGGMTFTGSGTTTLAGANTFTGNITVDSGKLGIGGTYTNTVNVGGTAGLVVADPAAPIGTLTVPVLSLSSGASVTFETGGGTASDKIVVSGAGGLSLGTTGITLYDSGTTNSATEGTYTLFEYNGTLTGSVGGLSVLNPRPGYTYNFQDTGGAITVQVASVDADGDGMTDAYETANGLNPNDATGVNGADGNLDGDFASNYEEFLAGTAADDPDSDPLNTDNDGLPDSWEVANFGNIEAQAGSDDFDGDFDTNLQEFTNATDPADAAAFTDSEPDGMGDGWEILHFGSAAAKDGTADTDGDLFTDLEEYTYGSDPNDSAFSPAFGKAAHRWSFTGTLEDSVGDSDATIENGATSNTNPVTLNAASVTLAGGAKADSQWVKLGSNLLPEQNSPCTIQLWATMDAIQNWARVFDFHSGTAESLFMSWTVGTGAATDRVNWNDPEGFNLDNTNSYLEDTQYHIVLTIQPSASVPGSSVVKWYSAPAYDGSLNVDLGPARGTVLVANSLAFMQDTINALGYSPWPDNTASATYDEVRIWDGALPQWALQGLHEQGPDDASQEDSDNDKLPDAFENFYFQNLDSGPNDDPDGDFSTNLQELYAGSAPNDSFSSPDDSDADGLPDAWELQYFGNLTQDATGDPDGDFAFNDEELAASTDPSLYTSFPDSDSDGMSDGWEISYFFDLSDDGTSNGDGDHLDSLGEFQAMANPTDPLSPGVPDGDSDDDGLPDRWEAAWFDPQNIGTQAGGDDSDSDGATNLQEYQATSDPTDNASTPADINGDGEPDQHVFHGMTSAGSGPQDKDGESTPFANRLANTGTALPAVDPNLDLDTAAGTLSLTTTTADINGQVNMAQLEALGIPLSSLGFTGNQDFRIRAHFVNMPALGGFDQIGAYVGTSSTSMTRSAVIGGNRAALGVNTNGTNDTDGFFGAVNSAGLAERDLTVIIERIGGVWGMYCNDSPCAPGAPPAFLDGNAALEAGVFVLDGGSGDVHKTAVLESFTAVSFGGSSGDSDGDGLDDAWEVTYFGSTGAQDGTGDPDADGTDNRAEFLLGLSPVNGSERFLATASDVTPGTAVTLTWPAQDGLTFTVWRSTTLGEAGWTQLGGTITATGTTATYTDTTAPAGKAFYRIELTTP